MADIVVLLDNDALKVFFLKGNSDFLVVTFSPMNFNPSSLDDFYCKAPLVKLGISGISITAKQNHWYPEKYMNEAMSYIVQITKQYKYVILLGVSMAGYAAIKYSKKILATHIIAMMPQWSIQPDEIDDPRYRQFYDENLHRGMSNKQEDIAGKLYLIFDKYETHDLRNAEKIIAIASAQQIIHTPFVGHTLGRILIGTEFLGELFTRVLYPVTQSSLVVLIHHKIHTHPMRFQGVVRNCLATHPALLIPILRRLDAQHIFYSNELFIEEFKQLIRFVGRQDKLLAMTMLSRVKYLNVKYYSEIIASNCFENVIMTAHLNILCFDLLRQQFLLKHYKEIDSDMFVIPIKFFGENGILGFKVDEGIFLPLNTSSTKNVYICQTEPSNMTPFFMYRKIDDFYVISNGKYYATATPKQTVDFGVAHIKNWEKFYKVSLQRYIENLGTIGESK